jgi:flagellar basal body-associated protein FliL
LAIPTFPWKVGIFFSNQKVGMKMESREEPKTARIFIIAILIIFAVLAICVAAYYYTFHGYKKQKPAVAPTAAVIFKLNK